MHLFRRAVAQLGTGKDSVANRLARRQEGNSTSLSASPASDGAATTLPTSSEASPSAEASPPPSFSETGEHTVTDFISIPEPTATRTTAYTAHGVNATIAKQDVTSTYTASEYLATANASAPGIPENELTSCQINETLPDAGPFCSPIHLQDLWVGYTYAITWNPALFPSNASNSIVMKYDNDDQDLIWNSSIATNGKSYANINMQKEWLRGRPGNDSTSGQNMTLFLQSSVDDAMTKGPTISLVLNPSTLPRVRIPRLPAKYGLEIGVPIGAIAAVIIILAIWCGMRKHQRSWKDVKGHGKDYMARRARRRGTAGKEGGIQLNDYDSERRQDAFSDEPYIGGSGNAFRDEIAKQRAEDDRYRPTVHSY